MKENVGQVEQTMRAAVGPLMLAGGYVFGGRKGRGKGLLAMLAGALVTETAITRTCPLNSFFGIDTTQPNGGAIASGERRQSPRASAQTRRGAEEPARRSGLGLAYDSFVNAAFGLSFIADEETADAAIKAVIGMLASRLEEPAALRLAASLPDPLSLEKLRGKQIHVTDLSIEQYYDGLSRQFDITAEQAQVLAVTILRLVKEALDADGISAMAGSLPDEWRQLLERV